MMTADDIRQLPKDEKLRLMELIWSDLTATDDNLISPGWHGDVLKETAERVAAGEELPVDWAQAKRLSSSPSSVSSAPLSSEGRESR